MSNVKKDVAWYSYLIYSCMTREELALLHTCIGIALNNGSLPYKEYPGLLELILEEEKEITKCM